MKSFDFVRVITTVKGDYRNRGVGHNFRDMDETETFIGRMATADLSGIKQIRIIPTDVTFTNPKDAAEGLDGKRGRCW